MKIGELASQAGCDVETVRFYEREGLLEEPRRDPSGYRRYAEQHLHRLQFIRHCRSLDMALGEIRTLLRFKDCPSENCGEVDALLDSHIQHVAKRVREHKALEKQLKALRGQCRESATSLNCEILKELSRPKASSPSRRQHVHGTHR